VATLPTGTVTFLFTDIASSTRLLQELGEESYARVLARHHSILREAFQAHGGIEVDAQGDAFFVAFTDAHGAADAARRAQLALKGGQVAVRMGMHSGEPLVWAEGYVGEDVHRAARICAAAHGGQVVVSERTRELVDAQLVDLGLHRLKDLSEPQRLFQLGDGDFPPLRTLYRTNLPVQPSPLVGRARELAETSELLAAHRLVTLTGAGGSGKTRLALQLAADVADDYLDGVYWVPLQAVREAELVLPAIAAALGAKDGLSEHIADGKMLLLLDNLEQVVGAAPLLAELLSQTANLRMIATSREPLRITGEYRYSVEPLPEGDAVALFSERAQAVDAAFEPTEAVAAICRRLDGLPLALELAAARAAVLDAESLLARLERALPVLTHGGRDVPERQRTLRATLDWSYDMLNESEQRLFTQLAVFVDGCTLGAAEQVCETDLDTLQSLVEKNLLRREGERYQMLATIREYAAEQLAQAGEEEGCRRRHARHYLERACELYDQRSWFDDLDRRYAADAWFNAERENLRAAFAHFVALGDRQGQLALGGAAQHIWTAGRISEGRRVLARLLEQTADERTEARRRALMTASWLAWLQGDLEEALRLAEEALVLARSAGDPYPVAVLLLVVHACALELRDLDRARAAAEEGERRAREHEMKHILVGFVSNRASLEAQLGNLAAAREVFREALALNAEIGGSRRERALILLNLGQIAVEEGELLAACALFGEAVDLVRERGDFALPEQLVAGAVEGFASIAVGRGEPVAAARLLGAAHAWRQLDNIRLEGWERSILDRTLTAARAGLSTDEFASAFTAGTTLTLDEAVEYARATNLDQA
jgi:predicted ATPase/class 3 adenylate cyclase